MIGTRVDVYRNLHDDCYSIKCMEPSSDDYGRVIGHADQVLIDDPEFVVHPSGLKRYRRTGDKNAHAFVRGVVEAVDDEAGFGTHQAWAFDYKPLSPQHIHRDRPFVFHEFPGGRPIDHFTSPPDKVLLLEDRRYGLFDPGV